MATLRRSRRTIDIWPGFVDALASLLMVFVFVLLIFMLAQFFLTDTLAGRNRALEQLRDGIEQLSDTLSLEQRQNEELQARIGMLSTSLEQTRAERDTLSERLAEAEKTIAADRETIELKLRAIASLEDDIDALKQVRDDLERKVGALASTLEDSRNQGKILRDRTQALEAKLADEIERTSLAQKQLDERDIRIEELTSRIATTREALAEQKQATGAANTEIRQLNQRIGQLRDEVQRLASALDASEARVADQKVEIEDLGRRLNVALAQKVEELKAYRSEFFGRLREVLGDRPDIRVEGDRFLFQSELLFDTGSADIGDQGKEQLRRLAATLQEVSAKIPSDVDWILRVDGHTDRRPINTEEFPSNWALSTARALSIVRFLIDEGVPPRRLAAAGFAEYHPLDPRITAEAYSRNRRIEIKLTRP